MRLFVAIELDDESRASIAAALTRLQPAAERGAPLRWTRPEHLHLTLVFIGEVDEARAAAIQDAIARPVGQPPFDVAFGGIGAFPPRGAPRALWVGAQRGAAEIGALQREMADRVARLGVELERRAFSPHLTIARWKASRPSDRQLLLAAAPADDRPIARLVVDHATLYQSRLSSSGSTYTPLARANLTIGSRG